MVKIWKLAIVAAWFATISTTLYATGEWRPDCCRGYEEAEHAYINGLIKQSPPTLDQRLVAALSCGMEAAYAGLQGALVGALAVELLWGGYTRNLRSALTRREGAGLAVALARDYVHLTQVVGMLTLCTAIAGATYGCVTGEREL